MQFYFYSLVTIVVLICSPSSAVRERRQSDFKFPGPRSSSVSVNDFAEELDKDPTASQAEQQYRPTLADPQSGSQQQYRPNTYNSDQSGSQQQGYRNAPTNYRQQQPSSKPSYGTNAAAEAARKEAEAEEQKPTRLEILLGNSKFTCSSKKDGYYADDSVNCQVFHYCVSGAKHSWMCPEGTVFHQVHLNCVPESQDICSRSEKFYIVNDYLHKELESKGPNNTILYHQRYYPEEFLGDPLTAAFPAASAPLAPASQSYGGQSYPRENRNPSPDSQSYGYAPSYQNYPSRTPQQSYVPKPAAPAPQVYTPANYAPATAAPTPRRPSAAADSYPTYGSYPDTSYSAPSPKPAAPSTYQQPQSYQPQSSYQASSYPAASNKPSTYQSPQSYSPASYSSNSEYRPAARSSTEYRPAVRTSPTPSYKPTAPKSTVASYPTYPGYQQYGGNPSYGSSAAASRLRYGPESMSYEPYDDSKSGVTYEDDY